MRGGGAGRGLTARLAWLVAYDEPVREDDAAMSDTWRDVGERAFVDTVGVLFAGAATPPVVPGRGAGAATTSGGWMPVAPPIEAGATSDARRPAV